MPTVSQLVAGLAFLAALAGWAWAITTEIPTADPGRPRLKAEPVQKLEAVMPTIGSFETYHVNKENPFVPWQQRQVEAKAGPKTTATGKPLAPKVEQPPAPVLPLLEPQTPETPVCQGIMVLKGKTQVLGIMPGETTPRWVTVGQTVQGWRLERVEDGATTVWTNLASGDTLHLTVTPELQSTAAPTAGDGKGAKPLAGAASAAPKTDKADKAEKAEGAKAGTPRPGPAPAAPRQPHKPTGPTP